MQPLWGRHVAPGLHIALERQLGDASSRVDASPCVEAAPLQSSRMTSADR
jgi:hypothetical protein